MLGIYFKSLRQDNLVCRKERLGKALFPTTHICHDYTLDLCQETVILSSLEELMKCAKSVQMIMDKDSSLPATKSTFI